MFRPQIYSKFNKMQQAINAKLFNEYFGLLKFNSNENILEIGCGTGQSTTDTLRRLPKTVINKFVASDINADMLAYAKVHACEPKVEYIQMDITKSDDVQPYENEFHKIISTCTLHWVSPEEQMQTFQNIRNLLKRDGCIFLGLVAESPNFTVYQQMYNNEKWKQYMRHAKEYTSPYSRTLNGTDYLIDCLKNHQFNIDVISRFNLPFRGESQEEFKNTIKAVNGFIHRISTNLHEAYWNDYWNAHDHVLNGDEYSNEIIFVYARKK